jgi:hypothetical protein
MSKKFIQTLLLLFIFSTFHWINTTHAMNPSHESDEEFNSRMNFQQNEYREMEEDNKQAYINSDTPSAPPPFFDPNEEAGNDEARIAEFQNQ